MTFTEKMASFEIASFLLMLFYTRELTIKRFSLISDLHDINPREVLVATVVTEIDAHSVSHLYSFDGIEAF